MFFSYFRYISAYDLEGEDLADFDLAPNPSLLVTMELEPAGVPEAEASLWQAGSGNSMPLRLRSAFPARKSRQAAPDRAIGEQADANGARPR